MGLIFFRIFFVYLFYKELKITLFKKEKNKLFWIILVFLFGAFGYFFYLIYKRRLVIKRTFQPKFNNRNSLI